jgi:DNA-binding CsgD family transcriptional regulator
MNNPHKNARTCLYSREQIVLRHGNGEPVAAIATAFGISVRTVFKLLKRHRDHGHEAHLAGLLAYERMISLGLGHEANEKLLSGREHEVPLWLCAGYRVSMIADKLGISESAVNLYLKNARAKLGAKTREQAVARAIFSGQIEL